MRIDKILNNNVITSINENDEEVIIMESNIPDNIKVYKRNCL